jgi:hypothetical protein
MARRLKRFDNLDSVQNAFFERQLEVVKAKTYDTKYPALRAREFIPVATDVDPDAQTVTYRGYTAVALAKILASYADDLPRVDVYGAEKSVQVKGLGDAYGYGLDEIRAAAKTGVALEAKKASAARLGIETTMDRILATGDAATGLLGLLNQASALGFTVPNGATGSALWADKTPEEILADMIGICEYVVTQTNQVEQPNTLLLPRVQFVKVSTTPMFAQGGSNVTILEFFKKNYPGVMVDQWLKLAAAGANSTDRMTAYTRDPDHLEAICPRDFEQLPVQERGLEFIVPCHARCGGVIVYYPLSMAYGDGV